MSEGSPRCPRCGCCKVWRSGIYRGRQRWLCRSCGYRFSETEVELDVAFKVPKPFHSNSDLTENVICGRNPSFKEVVDGLSLQPSINVASHGKSSESTIVGQHLNRFCNYSSARQIGASGKRAKNLAEMEPLKIGLSAEATRTASLLGVYAAKLLTMGLKERTVKCRLSVLKLLQKRGANLLDPVSVFKAIDHAKRYNCEKKALTDEEWEDGTKNNAMQAYKAFCKILGIHIPEDVNFDKYSEVTQKLPFVPLEKEIMQLVGGCSHKIATFIQLLKETGARSGEAWRLKWMDVDTEHGVMTINKPEKRGYPRQFKVSSKLAAMLNMLPKTSQKLFGDGQLDQFRKNFSLQRNRVAKKVQNPRIRRITFHTLRHFYGTMEYHKTKDILHIQERLGHRDIKSTLIYTHLVNFEGDEYYTATAKSLKEDEELLKAGFEYVTERDGVKIYRKRK